MGITVGEDLVREFCSLDKILSEELVSMNGVTVPNASRSST